LEKGVEKESLQCKTVVVYGLGKAAGLVIHVAKPGLHDLSKAFLSNLQPRCWRASAIRKPPYNHCADVLSSVAVVANKEVGFASLIYVILVGRL
jgi:hypothetical protein